MNPILNHINRNNNNNPNNNSNNQNTNKEEKLLNYCNNQKNMYHFDINKMKILILNEKQTIHKDKIGIGGYGKVMSGEYLNTQTKIAIKIPWKDKNNDSIKELFNINRFRHPNTPRLIGINSKIDCVKIISEQIQGITLENMINNDFISNPNSELMYILYFIDLANIILYLHEINLIHRDLKPTNIMVDNKDNCKLLDFGISKKADNTVTETKMLGTISYMAPENFYSKAEKDTIRNQSEISIKVDIWGFGCVLSQAFSGEKPWSEISQKDDRPIIGRLLSGSDFLIPKALNNKLVIKLVDNCCKNEPRNRINAYELKYYLLECLFQNIEENKNTTFVKNKADCSSDKKSKHFIF